MRRRTSKPPLAIVESPPVAPPAPPRTVGPTGQDLWARVQAEFGISDVGSVELLAQACEAADLVQEVASALREGKTLQTKTGLRAHPALPAATCTSRNSCGTMGLSILPMNATRSREVQALTGNIGCLN
jgi:hypothetical protein